VFTIRLVAELYGPTLCAHSTCRIGLCSSQQLTTQCQCTRVVNGA